MAKRLKHDEVMELAVELTCAWIAATHPSSPDAEDLILDFYHQIRHVEDRLGLEYLSPTELEEERAAAS